MKSYYLFVPVLMLLFLRLVRPGKFRERLALFSLLFLLLLSLALHSGVSKLGPWVAVTENTAWILTGIWLALDPVLGWFEKRKQRKGALTLLQNGRSALTEMINACRILAQTRQGGLMAIERKDRLDPWIEAGIPLEAKIRRETIYSVFTPPGALHDGGMIIRQDRIAACGVVFPLSQRRDLPTELGTRHRAGLGLSEATDALVIIISEETGKISLAEQGKLIYDVKLEQLPEMLEKALRHRLLKEARKKKSRAQKPAAFILPKTA